jgi:hypothetical protein
MLSRLTARLQRWATGRNVLILLVVFLLFEIVILPVAGARIETYSGGFGPLDLTLGLSPAAIYQRLGAYGSSGRMFYLLTELTADVLFPITYGLFFSLALALVFERAFPADSPLQQLCLVPLAGMLIDFLENVGIVWMLLVYPQQLSTVAALTSAVTVLKWILTAISMLLLVVGMVALVMRRRTATPTSS